MVHGGLWCIAATREEEEWCVLGGMNGGQHTGREEGCVGWGGRYELGCTREERRVANGVVNMCVWRG